MVLLFTFFVSFGCLAWADLHIHTFVIQSTNITRLCENYTMVTVNGQLPGPTLYARNDDTLNITVVNRAQHNATIHWHGIRQIRTAWADGPEYITQCPIQPGGKFTYTFTSFYQEGTLWWHAHVSWLRTTVHGAMVILPKNGCSYPFTHPHAEIPLVLGEWWNTDPIEVEEEAKLSGGAPKVSDAFTINGQPGDLYSCSTSGTTRFAVQQGKTYLLRIVNAAVNNHLFFKVASHNLTVVSVDASYTKPYTTDILMLTSGQTTDVLPTANQVKAKYYIAAKVYTTQDEGNFDNTTTTAIMSYVGSNASATPICPELPIYNDTATVTTFSRALTSLASQEHPVDVPRSISDSSIITVGLGLLPCATGATCGGPENSTLSASMNNISFVLPKVAILQAFHFHIDDVYTTDFPSHPPVVFDYTGDVDKTLWAPISGTKVKVIEYNATVQIVFQGTNIFQEDNHPIHIHGYDFYVVGEGFGNFNNETDPSSFNLVDPPQRNTVGVPFNGWTAVRFKASNPGVRFVHCHFNDHVTVKIRKRLSMVLQVKNGPSKIKSLKGPPNDRLEC
ncbi:laccase-3-like [Cryptomeria japonica]|uniref:laccase-3-like n=1 Tax=Cryptomeria japonica TaxID=3369 RepID=UPI0027DAADF4|nr:laccase-3-like [Cryptomeria japonica]